MDLERIAHAAKVVVRANTPLLTAISALQREGLSRAPVVDDEQRLVGELRGPWQKMRLFDSASRARILRVANAMSWDTLAICSSSSLPTARERLRERNAADAYVVSSDLRLVGLVTAEVLDAELARSGPCGASCACEPVHQRADCQGRWCRAASICADAIVAEARADGAQQREAQ